MDKEILLLDMVLDMLKEQSEYFRQRKLGYQASQQLELCKKKEKTLKHYCIERKKEIASKQMGLFV